ncbi:unnamed protein product [Acanthoscelides obtectus]|uniref:Uncharacterized protein n=1 Tax=Acanthoscelides obtectus TaxID=200917 RepID=A0A9P0NVJ2_ACAOB|nr:unnamed protein product [Acanthoscelides obtectus]CAK1661828.1 hypothetical protein AOBTE_LOCUS22822 [Acanthoscelides obtectus]
MYEDYIKIMANTRRSNVGFGHFGRKYRMKMKRSIETIQKKKMK